ncbi:hypothetical protein [Algoriphagus antarcticus]|uniref:Dolichyl-phosphate-mannose-protein mannosyltransferase n=1 Tax=Algoriphagus antarcticus TaxID=238540 RepID=A0A3E0E1I0_9BACT|nr:hypothetical protein [Algoriphagus antarcticus]REG91500.1 hypothetical protein C8N25_104114 [Algoriphagus antarcticus]
MDKIKTNSFLLFWSFLGLGALITIWFLPWRFQVNDDEIMMWLVSGAYTGEPESFAVFIHPILSWVFSRLYTLAPDIKWYPLTWFLVMYLSYLGLILSLDRAKIGYFWINTLSLFCLCLFLHFALFLQFTMVAGVAGFSGLLLLDFWHRKKSKAIFMMSLVLITFSVLIRWESYALMLIAFGFYFGSFRLAKYFFKDSRIFLIPFILLLVLVGTKIVWEKQSEYSVFLEYNKARASVSDHPVFYRHILDEKLDRESNWFFFSQWMMEDENISIKDLEGLKYKLDAEFFSLDQLFSSFTRLISVIRAEAFKSVFSFILIVLYFYKFKVSKLSLIFFGTWVLFFFIFNHFFVLNGRVVILFFLPLLFPLVLESTLESFRKTLFLILSTLVILLFGYHLTNFFKEANARQVMQDEYLSLTGQIPDNTLLVLEGYKENYLGINYSMENPVPLLSLGWISKSPFQKEKLHKIGLTQLSEAKEFYLLGVDIHEEFYFPEYMNFLSGDFQLVNKTELENFILFHYSKWY